MIYLVTGFMRSGTSMMMECLKAGGLPIVADESRDAWARTYGDAHYSNNPRGLYEPTQAAMRTLGFPRQHDGHALKLVLPFLHHAAVHEYRVVLMRRDPEEIRQSYYAAFRQQLGPQFIERYPRLIEEACLTLHNRRDVHSLTVCDYGELLSTPHMTLSLLAASGWPINIVQAASMVDPTQRRFHREHLVLGA